MIRTRVLLVDDEEDFVSALAERLRIRDYDAKVSTNGKSALFEIGNERPDIVLLDLKMPGMSGMETLEKIRAKDPSIEVIIVTGSVDSEVGKKALKAGASYHILKPIDIEDLMDNLRDIEKKHSLD